MRQIILIIIAIFSISASSVASTDSLRTTDYALAQKLKVQRKPMGALLRSVAFPGWGQYYNHKYIKSGVVFVTESFFLFNAIRWWSKTESQYNKVLADTNKTQQLIEFDNYQSYRGSRDDYLWASGLTIFISMFDAYVDAHLSGFDVDITPDFEGKGGGAQLRLRYRW